MSLPLDALFTSPDHFLHSFNGPNAMFVPMDRAAYHRSIFVNHRISLAPGQPFAVPIAALDQAARPALRTSWIFHMAHGGSTLLARALDDMEASLVIREPQSLRQTALVDPARLPFVLAMLGKRYRADAPTVVKANVPVNFLLPQIAAADPEAPAILLYMTLRAYLVAILRDADHRTWLHNIAGLLAPHLGDLSRLSDGERAAALWLAQINAFARTLAAMPNARALDSERFFAGPVETLQAAARQLEVPIADTTLAATATGPLFASYSKDPSLAFDNDARMARNARSERDIADELDAAESWIARLGSVPDLTAGAL